MCCIQHQQPVRRGRAPPLQRSRCPITREPRAPSASSQWRWGEMHPRTGAMERRCHPADHSLSAESCNGTPFSGILMAVLALGRSRLLELAAISTARSRVWPACKGSSISRRLFRLIPAYSLDIQPRWSRQQRRASWLFHLIAAPSLLFEWTKQNAPLYL